MEQINYQEVSDQIFAGYVKSPADIGDADVKNIEFLIEKYPYCQLAHSFYSKALSDKNNEAFKAALIKSAVYASDRKVLYAIINEPAALELPKLEDLEIEPSEAISATSVESPETSTSHIINDDQETSLENAQPKFENIHAFTLDQPIEKEEKQTEDLSPIEENSTAEEAGETEELIQEAITSRDAVFEKKLNDHVEEIIPAQNPEEVIDQYVTSEDEQIEYDEVSDFTLEQPFEKAQKQSETIISENQNPTNPETDEAEKLILGSIASTDFFAFQDKLDAHVQENPVQQSSEDALTTQIEAVANNKNAADALNPEKQVSKYDDDQMPFTFLWWLNKTRKEHEDTYQPFVKSNIHDIKESSGHELNHQIIENIFHLQSPVEGERAKTPATTVHFKIKHKEGEIIEKFIKEEPQIKPPPPEKLDLENKARKSAEDSNDLVSETLALIYIDQMLFHKAIDIFKKLSLKFPEKSTYFADQIRELEKKIN